jgi:hypothetical protein
VVTESRIVFFLLGETSKVENFCLIEKLEVFNLTAPGATGCNYNKLYYKFNVDSEGRKNFRQENSLSFE